MKKGGCQIDSRPFFGLVHEMCTKSVFLAIPLRKAKTRKPLIFNDFRVARDKGFEPLTFWSVDMVFSFRCLTHLFKKSDFMRIFWLCPSASFDNIL